MTRRRVERSTVHPTHLRAILRGYDDEIRHSLHIKRHSSTWTRRGPDQPPVNWSPALPICILQNTQRPQDIVRVNLLVGKVAPTDEAVTSPVLWVLTLPLLEIKC